MASLIAVALSAFVLALAATPFVRAIAVRRQWLDFALSSRKQHGRPVPRLGGLAILLACYGAVAAWSAASLRVQYALTPHLLEVGAIAVAGCAVAAVGFYDDLRGASARQKLLVQLTSGALLWGAGIRIDRLAGLPFLDGLELGPASLPVTCLWIAGISNAFNLVDGLDGLAAGLTVITGTAAMVVAQRSGEPTTLLLAAALTGSVCGFLAYNTHPASIFMGDTGSLFVGMVLAAVVLLPYRDSPAGTPIVGLAMLLAVPLVDMVLACARRALRGMPLFRGDHEHLHHRLVERGLGHWGAVLVLWGLATLLAAAAVPLASDPSSHQLLLGGAALLVAATVVGAGAVRLPDPATWARRRLNRVRMSEIRRVSGRIDRAARLPELRHDLASASFALGARSVRLRLAPPDARQPNGFARFALDEAHPWLGSLEVHWRKGQGRVDRDTEIAIEELCRHIAHALSRVRAGGRLRWTLDRGALAVTRRMTMG